MGTWFACTSFASGGEEETPPQPWPDACADVCRLQPDLEVGDADPTADAGTKMSAPPAVGWSCPAAVGVTNGVTVCGGGGEDFGGECVGLDCGVEYAGSVACPASTSCRR